MKKFVSVFMTVVLFCFAIAIPTFSSFAIDTTQQTAKIVTTTSDANIDATYTVSIPYEFKPTTDIETTPVYTVELSDIQIDYNGELSVTVDSDGVLKSETGDELRYSLYANNKKIDDDVLISEVAGLTDGHSNFEFYGLCDKPKYAGQYEGTITFNIELQSHTYTREEIDSCEYLFPIGKNDPYYVIAAFNEDYSDAVIFKNGSDSDGLMKNFNITTLPSPFSINEDTLTNITIKDGVTSIGTYAFFRCKKVTNITIAESVKRIENFSIMNCSSIQTLYIPKNVEYIVGNAVAGCSSLKEIIVNNENQYFCSYDGILFSKDMSEIFSVPIGQKLTEYKIPATVTEIGSYAFWNMKTLTNVIIPETVTEIGHYAFGYCSALTDLTIPESVRLILDYAFFGCKLLQSIKIPDGVNLIYDYTFADCTSLTEITIPNSVDNIDATAFENCPNLTTIYGMTNSFVKNWAIENGYTFVAIEKSQSDESQVT